MAASYFVRFKQRITGPYSAEQLRAMASTAQLTPQHEVSADRQQWTPADKVKGLFGASAGTSTPVATNTPPIPPSDLAAPSPGSPTSVPVPLAVPPPLAERWFVSRNGQAQGPLDMAKVSMAAQTGQLLPNDLVWREGETNSRKAIEIPELVHLFHHNASSENRNRFSTLYFNIFYFASVGLGLIGSLFLGSAMIFFAILFGIAQCIAIPASIFASILLYRCWTVANAEQKQSSPSAGQAVGFLFIPFYNIYWAFVAFPQLGIRLNSYGLTMLGTVIATLIGCITPLFLASPIFGLSPGDCYLLTGPQLLALMTVFPIFLHKAARLARRNGEFQERVI